MPTPIEVGSDLAGRTSATPVVIQIPGHRATVDAGAYTDGEEGRVSAAPAQRSAPAKSVQDQDVFKAVIRFKEMGFSAAQIESALPPAALMNDDDALAAAIAISTISDDLALTSQQHVASFRQERTLTVGVGARASPSSRELELEKQLEEAQLEIKRLLLEAPGQPQGNANSSNGQSGQHGQVGPVRFSHTQNAEAQSFSIATLQDQNEDFSKEGSIDKGVAAQPSSGVADDAARGAAARVPARVRSLVAMLRPAAASVQANFQAGLRDVRHHVAAQVLGQGSSHPSSAPPSNSL